MKTAFLQIPLALLFTFNFTLSSAYAFQPNPNVIFVDSSNVSGVQNGLSWATAFNKLQDAITASTYGNEIWIAKGTYYPDEGTGYQNNNRAASFAIPNGVKMIGGFAGSEESVDQKNTVLYKSILSGEIQQDTFNN